MTPAPRRVAGLLPAPSRQLAFPFDNPRRRGGARRARTAGWYDAANDNPFDAFGFWHGRGGKYRKPPKRGRGAKSAARKRSSHARSSLARRLAVRPRRAGGRFANPHRGVAGYDNPFAANDNPFDALGYWHGRGGKYRKPPRKRGAKVAAKRRSVQARKNARKRARGRRTTLANPRYDNPRGYVAAGMHQGRDRGKFAGWGGGRGLATGGGGGQLSSGANFPFENPFDRHGYWHGRRGKFRSPPRKRGAKVAAKRRSAQARKNARKRARRVVRPNPWVALDNPRRRRAHHGRSARLAALDREQRRMFAEMRRALGA